jgi:hypothetical protein
MKNKLLRFLSWSICAFILIFTFLYMLYNYGPRTFPSFFTVYSEDFNKESFEKITIGEDKKVVDSLLGQPLRESISNTKPDSIKDVYWYTKGRYYGYSYEKIFILFYEDKVSNIIRVVDMD